MSDLSIVNLTEATTVAVAVVAGDLPTRIPYVAVSTAPEGVGLVADPGTPRGVRARYETAKGGRLGVVGTSIDVGSGGDVANPNAVGRNSNGSPWTHLSLGSNGMLEIIKNGAVGGLTLGGIGVVMTEAPIGSDHLDIAVTRGPCLPFNTETLTPLEVGRALYSINGIGRPWAIIAALRLAVVARLTVIPFLIALILSL